MSFYCSDGTMKGHSYGCECLIQLQNGLVASASWELQLKYGICHLKHVHLI